MSRYSPAVTAYRARICAVALFVAPVVGACGAGGDEGRATGDKGRYVDQIDPICAELQGKIGDLGQDAGRQSEEIQAAVGRMRSVSKPSEDSERADLYLAAMENLFLSLLDVDQARAVNDQPRAGRALEGARTNNQTAANAAKDYGMVECAKPL